MTVAPPMSPAAHPANKPTTFERGHLGKFVNRTHPVGACGCPRIKLQPIGFIRPSGMPAFRENHRSYGCAENELAELADTEFCRLKRVGCDLQRNIKRRQIGGRTLPADERRPPEKGKRNIGVFEPHRAHSLRPHLPRTKWTW
jgi:hypothetical protein